MWGGGQLRFGGPPWKGLPSGGWRGGPAHGIGPGTGPCPEGTLLPRGTRLGPERPPNSAGDGPLKSPPPVLVSTGTGRGGVGRRPTPGGGLGRGLIPCFFSSSTSFSSSAPASASSASILLSRSCVSSLRESCENMHSSPLTQFPVVWNSLQGNSPCM